MIVATSFVSMNNEFVPHTGFFFMFPLAKHFVIKDATVIDGLTASLLEKISLIESCKM